MPYKTKEMYAIAKETKLGLKYHQVIGGYKTKTYRIEEAAKYLTKELAIAEINTIESKGYKIVTISNK